MTDLGAPTSTEFASSIFYSGSYTWENGYAESFNGKFCDECLNEEVFYNRRYAQAVDEIWRRGYTVHWATGHRRKRPKTVTLSPINQRERVPDSHPERPILWGKSGAPRRPSPPGP